MSDVKDVGLLGSVYEMRREQVLFHLKGRDDALKHYLVVAAALAAASQSNQIGAAALLVIPLVAAGMALSFTFHHVYLGVNVAFLRREFAPAIASVPFVNWDESLAHNSVAWALRLITVGAAIVLFGGSSYLAFAYGMSATDSALVREPWLCPAGTGASIFAGGIVLLGSGMRYLIERDTASAPTGNASGASAPAKAPDQQVQTEKPPKTNTTG